MPHRGKVIARRRVRRLRRSTRVWIGIGVVVILFFLGMYVMSELTSDSLQYLPMPELGF